jgi:hypothetical protein
MLIVRGLVCEQTKQVLVIDSAFAAASRVELDKILCYFDIVRVSVAVFGRISSNTELHGSILILYN